ncbi:MAG: hypothetical protein LH624_07565, partial [Cryobacterium sp.]|nr:hypothetical protein [Cryobacterium sp.]
MHVDVSGPPAQLVCSQQDPAFEGEVAAELSAGEPVDEPFETVKGEDFAGGSTSGTRQGLQVGVGLRHGAH